MNKEQQAIHDALNVTMQELDGAFNSDNPSKEHIYVLFGGACIAYIIAKETLDDSEMLLTGAKKIINTVAEHYNLPL